MTNEPVPPDDPDGELGRLVAEVERREAEAAYQAALAATEDSLGSLRAFLARPDVRQRVQAGARRLDQCWVPAPRREASAVRR